MKIDKKNEANATNLGDLSEKKPLIEENRLRTLQRNTKKWKYTLSGLALFILIMGSVAVYFLSQQDQDIRQQASSIENSNISSKTNPPTSPQPKTDTISWDECVKAADSRILQTYPSICVHPDGRRATNTLPSTQPVSPSPTPLVSPSPSPTPLVSPSPSPSPENLYINSNISSKTNPPTSPQPKTDTISWDECVKAADSRILQTYPSICVHPDGRRATNTLPSTQPVKENFIQQIITNVTSLYSRVYNFFSIN